jgi:hypothetical protein
MRAAKCEKTTNTRDAIETKRNVPEDGMVAEAAAQKNNEKRMASPESVLSQSATPRLEVGSGIFAEFKYTGKWKPGEGSSESADKKERRKEGQKRKESKVSIAGK